MKPIEVSKIRVGAGKAQCLRCGALRRSDHIADLEAFARSHRCSVTTTSPKGAA